VDRQITNAFEVGADLERCGQQAQVARHWLPQCKKEPERSALKHYTVGGVHGFEVQ
jgi:hypothetical protein